MGSDGGLTDKPVGLVWAAIAAPGRTETQKFTILRSDRQRNIELTAKCPTFAPGNFGS